MKNQPIEFLVGLTTGKYLGIITAMTASFDAAKGQINSVLVESSSSLTFDALYSVESKQVAIPSISGSEPTTITNYVIKSLDTSELALQAAFTLSASFL